MKQFIMTSKGLLGIIGMSLLAGSGGAQYIDVITRLEGLAERWNSGENLFVEDL